MNRTEGVSKGNPVTVDWRRNLYALWVAQFIAMSGMSSVVPFLPFFLRDLGVEEPGALARWSGLAFSGPFFVSFLATPFWGWIGDRRGRKPMVVRAIFGLAVAQVLISLSQTPAQLLLGRMLQGGISGFIAAAMALVATTTPEDRMGFALGTLQTATATGTVLGPLLGGILADLLGYRPIFWVVAGLCVASGVVVLLAVKERDGERESRIGPLHENYRMVFARPLLLAAAVGVFLTQSCLGLVQSVFALFVEGMLEPTPYLATITGLVYGTQGIFNALGAPWWGRRVDRTGYQRNLKRAILLAAGLYALHAAARAPWQLALFRAGLGFCLGGIQPVLYSLVARHTPLRQRGGVLGVVASFTTIGNMVGPVSGGILGSIAGLRAPFLLAAGLLFLNAALLARGLARKGPETEGDPRGP